MHKLGTFVTKHLFGNIPHDGIDATPSACGKGSGLPHLTCQVFPALSHTQLECSLDVLRYWGSKVHAYVLDAR